ncbi:hypothetical protein EAH_00068240, partial [Eimeria acervulina]
QDEQLILEEEGQGLCCVAFSVYCHTAGAHKCKIKLSGVLNIALDLAAGALCIAWGYLVVLLTTRCAAVIARKDPKWYVVGWLGGFEWPIFVGVDEFAYDKMGC